MSKQPEALRLAEFCDGNVLYQPAAAKLRRQHAEIESLRREQEEDQCAIRVWRRRADQAEAKSDALLRALNMAVQWVEEYASQMRAYTTSEQANADLSVIYAVIKAVKEGK